MRTQEEAERKKLAAKREKDDDFMSCIVYNCIHDGRKTRILIIIAATSFFIFLDCIAE